MEDFSQEVSPSPITPETVVSPHTGRPVEKPKAYTGYPHHKPGGRGFAKGHKKLGGIKKGTKRFKTLFIEELENTGIDEQGRSGKNSYLITKKAIQMAREGNLMAIQFIIERVDGKIPQVVAGDENNPLTIVIEKEIGEKYLEQPK